MGVEQKTHVYHWPRQRFFWPCGRAIHGTIIAVGNAPFATHEGSVRRLNTGIGYVFRRNRGGLNTWQFSRKLLASDRQAGDILGSSIAIQRSTIATGATGDDIDSNKDQGSVYIFK